MQLGNLELSTYVQGELEQNPFLERQEESAEPSLEAPSAERSREDPLSGTPDMTPHQDAADAWSTAPDEGWADPGGEQGFNRLDVAGVGADRPQGHRLQRRTIRHRGAPEPAQEPA